jgi:hypothetical protein
LAPTGSLVAALIALLPLHAAAANPTVNVLDFRPTQMEIGKAAAQYHVDKWLAHAQKKGLSLRDYALKVLQPKFAQTKIPSVIDPSGAYRNTDGHHRVTELREVTRLTGVQFEVIADVQKDYRGDSFEQYANHFIGTLKKGEFTPAAQALPPVQRMRQLPASYAGMIDNPMRSALEVVFHQYGLTGTMMQDYVEFRLGRRLIADGLLSDLEQAGVIAKGATELPTALSTDPRVVAAIVQRLRQPVMRDLLISEARDQQAARALKELLKNL